MNVLYAIASVVLYFGFGSVLGYIRWSRYVRRELVYYDQMRRGFLKHFKVRGDEIPEFLKLNWRETINRDERLKHIPPSLQDHKGNLIRTITLWPMIGIMAILRLAYRLTFDQVFAAYKRLTNLKQLELVRKDLER
jgi:hypothetical protein